MSTGPMQFPRPSKLLLWIFLGFLGAPAIVAPFLMLTWWRLDAVQSFYFVPYLESAIEGDSKGAWVTVQYASKTAPGRLPAPLMPGDAEHNLASKTTLSLSAKASAEGWRGIALSAPRKTYPPALETQLRTAIFDGESAFWMAGQPMLIFLGVLLIPWLAIRTFRSGSQAQSAYEERHGRRTKGPELSLANSRFRNSKEDGIRLRMQSKGLLSRGSSYSIPKRLESSHILLMGDTGSGKSSAIRQILRQVEQRGDSAIVYDPAMDFVGEFYSPERGDLVLNPLDARCPWWDLKGELSGSEIAMTIAAAMLPEKEFEKSFFTDAPRRVLARLLLSQPTPADLVHWMSDPEEITERMKGTPQASLVDPGAPAQRAGVLSSLNLIADSLELLPAGEPFKSGFSTADWKTTRKRWVFLTSSAAYREKLLPLHSVWLDLFILRMMEPCADAKAKPVWFVLDELASLNKLPQLHAAVTENRKYGNPVVMGLQGKSQMEKRYGKDAEAMLSQPATKIFLKTSEPRAAKWVSDAIGEVEVERLKESRSMELLGAKQSFAMEIATKPLVMPSEIAGLAPLRGYIKQENSVVPARFVLAAKKLNGQPDFIARGKSESPSDQIALSSSEPFFQKPVSSEPPAVMQAELPAVEQVKPEKVRFRWDQSREIE